MVICWDNLEKIRYRFDKNLFQHRNFNFYYYKDSCENCGEPYLTLYKNGKYCSIKCRSLSKKYRNNIIESKTKGYYKKNIPTYNKYNDKISYVEETRRNIEDENILEVKCAYCGKWYIPSLKSITARISSLEGKKLGESRLYCSTACKKECPIYGKQLWPDGFKQATGREVQQQLRQLVFERDNYTCQKCNKHQNKLKVGLHCHHIEGIRWEPLESADMDKCITLCKTCHKQVHKIEGCSYYDLRCGGDSN